MRLTFLSIRTASSLICAAQQGAENSEPSTQVTPDALRRRRWKQHPSNTRGSAPLRETLPHPSLSPSLLPGENRPRGALRPAVAEGTGAQDLALYLRRGARPSLRDRQDRGLSDLAAPAQKVEMLFAHLERILKLDRLRLHGPNGVRDEFHLADTDQNLSKLAMLVLAVPPIPGW